MNYIMLKISTKLELSFFHLRFLMHTVNLIIGTQKPKKKNSKTGEKLCRECVTKPNFVLVCPQEVSLLVHNYSQIPGNL